MCPSIYSFPYDNFSTCNINVFSSNLVCALILWRSGLGIANEETIFDRVNLPRQDGGILSFLIFIHCIIRRKPGPSCSKLMMSLVNVSLILIIKYGIYANIFAEKMWVAFAFKSYPHFFFSKNTCELDIVLTRAVNILTTNELVKLTML